MGEHEPCIGATSEWYTPKEIFASLGLTFDLDPCSPGPGHWVPAAKVFTEADDGLAQEWRGLVFMNPPFGGRNGHIPWLRKFIAHGNGIGIVRAYTSSAWWHDWIPLVDAVVFPKGKTKFVRPDGTIGKAPGHGVALLGMGPNACDALYRFEPSLYWDVRAQREQLPAFEVRSASAPSCLAHGYLAAGCRC